MESQLFFRLAIASFIAATVLLAGCATPSAPNFHGAWKPVNRYAASTTAIPLARAYNFFATPMDDTLKTMLSRWCKDTGIKLSYDVGADYTLPAAVAQINTSDISLAVSQLAAIYAPQGITLAASSWQISVRGADAPSPKEVSAATNPAGSTGARSQR